MGGKDPWALGGANTVIGWLVSQWSLTLRRIDDWRRIAAMPSQRMAA
jgi:hypothetical protein